MLHIKYTCMTGLPWYDVKGKETISYTYLVVMSSHRAMFPWTLCTSTALCPSGYVHTPFTSLDVHQSLHYISMRVVLSQEYLQS